MAEAATSTGISGRRILLVMVAIVAVAAIPAVIVPMIFVRAAPPELTDLGTLPPFQLVDDHGRPFTEDALRGHATIVSFVFTRCDTICPTTTMKMTTLQEQTALDDGIKLLSISVDPAYDTPARLAAYAKHYRADDARWRFVTGAPERVHDLVERGFLTNMVPDGVQQNGAPNIAHRGYLMLVDGALAIRGKYETDSLHDLEAIVRAARYLTRTTR